MDSDSRSSSIALSTNTCWALLRSTEVGRLAVAVSNDLDIFPINFLVDHGTVLFRTAEGTKLTAAVGSPRIAFEADGYDGSAHEAWSVVIKGHAEEITHMDDLLDAMTFPLFPWHAGPKGRFVRIVPTTVSGRRFRTVDETSWRTPMTDAPRSPVE